MKRIILFNYAHEVAFRMLSKLPVGGMIAVDEVAKNDPQKFIECVKDLIDHGFYMFEFSNDYKFVKRINTILEWKR